MVKIKASRPLASHRGGRLGMRSMDLPARKNRPESSCGRACSRDFPSTLWFHCAWVPHWSARQPARLSGICRMENPLGVELLCFNVKAHEMNESRSLRAFEGAPGYHRGVFQVMATVKIRVLNFNINPRILKSRVPTTENYWLVESLLSQLDRAAYW